MFSVRYARNPCFLASTWYCPMGRSGKTNVPAVELSVVRLKPVATFVHVTVVPVITPPDESSTVPPMRPVAWPNIIWMQNKNVENTNRNVRKKLGELGR